MDIQLDEKRLYYSIREVAEMFGVNESLLRYWETEFPQYVSPRKGARGVRSYKKEDIEKIRVVYDLVKVRGLKLAAAREILKQNKTGVPQPVEMLQHLRAIRSELVAMKQAINDL